MSREPTRNPIRLDRETKQSTKHIEACILSYIIYNQTLFLKFDPYADGLPSRYRDTLLDRLRNGTGSDNADFTQFFYDHISPRDPAMIGRSNKFRVITPPRWAQSIRQVYLCFRDHDKIRLQRSMDYGTGNINVYCFEGLTGHNTMDSEKGNRSIMGYISHDTATNELMITFRGSQSGAGLMGNILKGLFQGKGNADWITDTNCGNFSYCNEITPMGAVGTGFALSAVSCFPTIELCLMHLFQHRSAANIDNISITGHSLGGGLALMLKSAFSFGDFFHSVTNIVSRCLTRDNTQRIMGLFEKAACYTFGAPHVGNEEFAYIFRATRADREVRRHFIDKDIITKIGAITGGYHIGIAKGTTPISPTSMEDAHTPDIIGAHVSGYHAVRLASEQYAINADEYQFNTTYQRSWIVDPTLSGIIKKYPRALDMYIKQFNIQYFEYLISVLSDIYIEEHHNYHSRRALRVFTFGFASSRSTKVAQYKRNVKRAAQSFSTHRELLKKNNEIFAANDKFPGNQIKKQLGSTIQIVVMGFIQNELQELLGMITLQWGQNTGQLIIPSSPTNTANLALKVFHILNNLLTYMNNQSGADSVVMFIIKNLSKLALALNMEYAKTLRRLGIIS